MVHDKNVIDCSLHGVHGAQDAVDDGHQQLFHAPLFWCHPRTFFLSLSVLFLSCVVVFHALYSRCLTENSTWISCWCRCSCWCWWWWWQRRTTTTTSAGYFMPHGPDARRHVLLAYHSYPSTSKCQWCLQNWGLLCFICTKHWQIKAITRKPPKLIIVFFVSQNSLFLLRSWNQQYLHPLCPCYEKDILI